jgi:hypothetical protein
VAASFQTLFGYGKMALRRRRNMHHIRTSFIQKHVEIVKVTIYRKPLAKLPGHQFFPIANPHNAAVFDPLNRGGVGIGNFTAADNSNLKHDGFSPGSFRNTY